MSDRVVTVNSAVAEAPEITPRFQGAVLVAAEPQKSHLL